MQNLLNLYAKIFQRTYVICGGPGIRTLTPAHHRPNGFQDRPLHQFE